MNIPVEMNTSMNAMQIISPSPSTPTKLPITSFSMPPTKHREATTTHEKNPSVSCSFDEYSLFLILEQERNLKLKEVYHKRGFVVHDEESVSTSAHSDLPLGLIFPPRYYNLKKNFSLERFVARLNSTRRPLPTKASATSWKSLDQMTLMFIRDLAAILRDQCTENYEVNRHSPVCTPVLNRSMTITPIPSVSPQLRRPADGLKALLMASELVSFPPLPFPVDGSLPRHQACQHVDLSDQEIRSMWIHKDEEK